jgi:TetR/AcrR family transcriptional regulator, cholesterol catabolism regulator
MTETKLGIQQKAQNLFFKYGIKSVTMDDIARELTISKKTLYQFFENKTDILQSIAHANKARDIEMIGKITVASKDAIDEMLHIAKYVTHELSQITSQTALYDMQKYYPEIWIQYMEFQQEFIYEQIKKNVTRGIEEGYYRPNIDADIIAKLYVSKTDCVIDEDMFPSKKYDKVKLFKEYFTYHIHGIATTKGLKLLEKRLSEFQS